MSIFNKGYYTCGVWCIWSVDAFIWKNRERELPALNLKISPWCGGKGRIGHSAGEPDTSSLKCCDRRLEVSINK